MVMIPRDSLLQSFHGTDCRKQLCLDHFVLHYILSATGVEDIVDRVHYFFLQTGLLQPPYRNVHEGTETLVYRGTHLSLRKISHMRISCDVFLRM